MDIGLYTDSLTEHGFERALDIAASSGVRSIEIATGGQSSAPHLDLDALLDSATARSSFLAAFARRAACGSPRSTARPGRCTRSSGRPTPS